MAERVPMRSLLLTAVMLSAATAAAQDRPERRAPDAAVFRPERVAATAERIAGLRLPEGFALTVAASDLRGPRMLAVGDDGSLYVTQPAAGEVARLVDDDHDGRFDSRQVVASGLATVHGIALRGGSVYLATPQQVLVATIAEDGGFGTPQVIIDDLPVGGRHGRRTLGFGPDGALYISVGSSCDACREANPEHATMLRARPDGGGREIFATGLRNTIGFAWHPETGELWGMDHGSDWRGNEQPPEELNLLQAGRDYGWPYCYGNRQEDRLMEPPPGITQEAFCARTEPARVTFEAHAAPIGMAFYTGTAFPPAYRNNAFVAMQGSWNRKPPAGYKVVRIVFEGGRPVGAEDFVTGFLVDNDTATFGTPAGIAVARDGTLLISDDTSGNIYRVRYTGDGR